MSASEEFFQAYVMCALWSSNDNADDAGGSPLDENYSIDDIALETLQRMRADCDAFVATYAPDLARYADELPSQRWSADEQAGHDFWLTRNRHGTGFWDRGVSEELGERLSEAAQKFGEVDLVVGDDGRIY